MFCYPYYVQKLTHEMIIFFSLYCYTLPSSTYMPPSETSTGSGPVIVDLGWGGWLWCDEIKPNKKMYKWIYSVNPSMLYLPITLEYMYIQIYCLYTSLSKTHDVINVFMRESCPITGGA